MLLVTLSFAHAAFATPAQDLTEILNKIHSLNGNFNQTIFDTKHKVLQKSEGSMALIRPGKFRWEVKKPLNQLLIANDQSLWIYDPDLQQVTIHKITSAARGTPAFLLSQTNSDLEKDFQVQTMKPPTPQEQWFLLIPKSKDNAFDRLQLGFSQGTIRAMNLEDNLGHTTVIEFQKMQVNTSLPTSLFVFKAPKNVDVINENER
jgi:outer membrane lipoprotein carrier protein